MKKILKKLKEIVENPEIKRRIGLDSEARFSVHLEWASLAIQWVGILSNNLLIILIGSVGFWYGFVRYVKNILRIYDEYKEEEKKKGSSNENEDTQKA